jgi:exodeoxyribonuclease III
VITLEFDEFFLVSVYVPNAGEGLRRLEYRVNEWDKKFQKYLNKLSEKKNVIVTGDFNVAHQEIDVYDPIGKNFQPGFTPLERVSFQKLLDSGFMDTYRHLYPDKQEFTFWAARAFARESNKGWRIDYFLMSRGMKVEENVRECNILANYTGSDHCPIKLVLK